MNEERERLAKELISLDYEPFLISYHEAIADYILADRARIIKEVIKILDGIDKDQIESSNGFWETSTGVESGIEMLNRIRKLSGVKI